MLLRPVFLARQQATANSRNLRSLTLSLRKTSKGVTLTGELNRYCPRRASLQRLIMSVMFCWAANCRGGGRSSSFSPADRRNRS